MSAQNICQHRHSKAPLFHTIKEVEGPSTTPYSYDAKPGPAQKPASSLLPAGDNVMKPLRSSDTRSRAPWWKWCRSRSRVAVKLIADLSSPSTAVSYTTYVNTLLLPSPAHASHSKRARLPQHYTVVVEHGAANLFSTANW